MSESLVLLSMLLRQLAILLGQSAVSIPAPISTFPPQSIIVSSSTTATLETKKSAPQILQVSPASGPAGTIVTISGLGFSRSANVVYTGAGEISVPSPDGKTLTFTLPRPSFLTDEWLSATSAYRRETYGSEPIKFPLGFYVKNENGLSVDAGRFYLTII